MRFNKDIASLETIFAVIVIATLAAIVAILASLLGRAPAIEIALAALLVFLIVFWVGLAMVARGSLEALWSRVGTIQLVGEIVTAKAENLARLTRIVDAYTRTRELGNSFLLRRADEVIEETAIQVENLAKGTVYVPAPRFYDIAAELVERARREVIATSYVETKSWWKSRGGEDYLRRNIEAVGKRHLKMTRIFIFDSASAIEESRELLEKQEAGGIDVYIVSPDAVETDLLKDSMLVDEEFAIELHLGPDRTPIGVAVENSESAVHRLQSNIRRLMSVATAYVSSTDLGNVVPIKDRAHEA